MTLVDSGPLIALIDASDQHHEVCVAVTKKIRQPLMTVWPAVTEAMYILNSKYPCSEIRSRTENAEAPASQGSTRTHIQAICNRGATQRGGMHRRSNASVFPNWGTKAQDLLWEMLERKTLQILPLDLFDMPRMRDLMKKYRNLPMDLADAALVQVAEREGMRTIFTVDSDFKIYRYKKNQHFKDIP